MKSRPVTKAQFARMLGVSGASVTKAVQAGRISVLANGKIDPVSARAQWIANTDPATSAVKPQKAPEPQRSQNGEAVSDAALTRIKALLTEQGVDVSGPLTLQLAKVAEVISRTEARELELAIRRREFVPLVAVQKHIERIFTGIKQAFQSMPSRYAAQVANELGAEIHATEWAMRRAVNSVLFDLSTPPSLAESVKAEPVVNTMEGASDE